MNRLFYAWLLLALALGLAFRAPEPASRPMHNDEAVNAIKLRGLMDKGQYRYDPDEYHGPTLIYSSLALLRLTGANDFVKLTEARLRGVTVLYGLGLILLLAGLRDALGGNAVFAAAILTAISPAMVFYSRYYIHETLLVFFTLAAMVFGWRYYVRPGIATALLLGASIGLMQATKETFVFPVASAAVAMLALRWLPGGAKAARPFSKTAAAHLSLALGAWAVVAAVLFSSFFTNANGVLDAVRTYLPWLHRVRGASPHLHPWGFYLERLLWFHHGRGAPWSEGIVFALALAGMVAAFRKAILHPSEAGSLDEARRKTFLRFLTLHTLLLTVIYSALSYKTTWCLLGFWQPMILLAGCGAAALWQMLRKPALKAALALLLLLFAIQLGAQSWRASVTESAEPGNPYDYAQTSQDLLGLVSRVNALATLSPDPAKMEIQVFAPESEYWPLPWYLRAFPRCGWHGDAPAGADGDATILIVSTRFAARMEADKTHELAGTFQLRPNTFLRLYVEKGLFAAYVRSGLARGLPE